MIFGEHSRRDIEVGVRIEEAQEALGHESIETTKNIYAHHTSNIGFKAFEQFDASFNGSGRHLRTIRMGRGHNSGHWTVDMRSLTPETADRYRRVLELRVAGHTFDSIATMVGYQGRQSAKKAYGARWNGGP